MPSIDEPWILTGPTGSGKTALALHLAQTLPIEIISADSMTHYRGMDIGTAKPTSAELASVPHHLINWLHPWERTDVAQWLHQAETIAADIRSRGKHPLFVGGTPFYLQALRFGLFPGPPSDPEVRQRLMEESALIGLLAFHAKLKAIDEVAAKRIHPNDTQRVVRALEVYAITGKPISSFQNNWQTKAFSNSTKSKSWRCVVLDWPREELYARIDNRVVQMMDNGWVEESKQLLKLERPISKEASQALGYKEIFEHLAGLITRDDAIARIQLRTRQFAKRQLTWFRNLGGTQWVTVNEVERIKAIFSQ